jgi:hypothetical protein
MPPTFYELDGYWVQCPDMDVNILRPLKGKSMVVFPTNHDYYDWQKLARQVDWCNLVISDMMESTSTDWVQDVGDYLLADYRANSCDMSAPTTATEQVIEVESFTVTESLE